MGEFYSLAWLTAIFYLLAGICAVRELLVGRTSQGTIAWLMALFFIPFITVWLYFAFGWKSFGNYRTLRTKGRQRLYRRDRNLLNFKLARKNPVQTSERPRLKSVSAQIMADERWIADKPGRNHDWLVQQSLVQIPFTSANKVEMLTDGKETLDALLDGLRSAQRTIIAQYYIIRDDVSGRAFADCLIERARAGVRVYLLYDAIGCYLLANSYFERLRGEGVKVAPFNESSYLSRLFAPFRINYRNHRKIVVIDSHSAWIGGYNIGDEYLGHGRLGTWRDTHLQLIGPAALTCQLAFVEDWLWTTGETIELNWRYDSPSKGTENVLIMPSGPADKLETVPISFLDAISQARQRLWIASPYFVPDMAIITALYAAVFRNVDVRVLVPRHADKRFVWLASLSYLDDLSVHGVKFYYYSEGFMHQKVMLVDDDLAAIGTVNFDNRSFRINFEITAWMTDQDFIRRVDQMLVEDFANSFCVDQQYFNELSLPLRLAARAARLFSPLL